MTPRTLVSPAETCPYARLSDKEQRYGWTVFWGAQGRLCWISLSSLPLMKLRKKLVEAQAWLYVTILLLVTELRQEACKLRPT